MARKIGQQTAQAKGTAYRNQAIKKIEAAGGTVTEIVEVTAKRRRRHALVSRPITFLIRYKPLVSASHRT